MLFTFASIYTSQERICNTTLKTISAKFTPDWVDSVNARWNKRSWKLLLWCTLKLRLTCLLKWRKSVCVNQVMEMPESKVTKRSECSYRMMSQGRSHASLQPFHLRMLTVYCKSIWSVFYQLPPLPPKQITLFKMWTHASHSKIIRHPFKIIEFVGLIHYKSFQWISCRTWHAVAWSSWPMWCLWLS